MLRYLLLILFCCSFAIADEIQFNFIFNYNGNVLDTFNGTYTENMYIDPSVTIKFSLSSQQLKKIHQKMEEIDFFHYPNKLVLSKAPGHFYLSVHPGQSYYFKVQTDSGIKELSWDVGEYDPKDKKVIKLKELIDLIDGMIYSREEVKKLPIPRAMPQ